MAAVVQTFPSGPEVAARVTANEVGHDEAIKLERVNADLVLADDNLTLSPLNILTVMKALGRTQRVLVLTCPSQGYACRKAASLLTAMAQGSQAGCREADGATGTHREQAV